MKNICYVSQSRSHQWRSEDYLVRENYAESEESHSLIKDDYHVASGSKREMMDLAEEHNKYFS